MSELNLLFEQTKILQENLNNGKLCLIEEELQNIFENIQKYTTPNQLEQAIEIFSDGTILLEKKLYEIQKFIYTLTQKNKIQAYLNNNPSEEQLNYAFHKSWVNPTAFPQLSAQFLINSWNSLVNHKRIREINQDNNFTDYPSFIDKEQIIIDNFEDSFDERMINYLNEIRSKLPSSLEDLLNQDSNPDIYFEHFSLILHLLQEDFLHFNPKSKEFENNISKEEIKSD